MSFVRIFGSWTIFVIVVLSCFGEPLCSFHCRGMEPPIKFNSIWAAADGRRRTAPVRPPRAGAQWWRIPQSWQRGNGAQSGNLAPTRERKRRQAPGLPVLAYVDQDQVKA